MITTGSLSNNVAPLYSSKKKPKLGGSKMAKKSSKAPKQMSGDPKKGKGMPTGGNRLEKFPPVKK